MAPSWFCRSVSLFDIRDIELLEAPISSWSYENVKNYDWTEGRGWRVDVRYTYWNSRLENFLYRKITSRMKKIFCLEAALFQMSRTINIPQRQYAFCYVVEFELRSGTLGLTFYVKMFVFSFLLNWEVFNYCFLTLGARRSVAASRRATSAPQASPSSLPLASQSASSSPRGRHRHPLEGKRLIKIKINTKEARERWHHPAIHRGKSPKTSLQAVASGCF